YDIPDTTGERNILLRRCEEPNKELKIPISEKTLPSFYIKNDVFHLFERYKNTISLFDLDTGDKICTLSIPRASLPKVLCGLDLFSCSNEILCSGHLASLLDLAKIILHSKLLNGSQRILYSFHAPQLSEHMRQLGFI